MSIQFIKSLPPHLFAKCCEFILPEEERLVASVSQACNRALVNLQRQLVRSDLPLEVMQEICLCLSYRSLSDFVCVNQRMKEIGLETLDIEAQSIHHFLRFVTTTLDEKRHREVINQLRQVHCDQTFKDVPNAAKYLSPIRMKLINILKTVDIQTLEDLSAECPPCSRLVPGIFEMIVLRKLQSCNRQTPVEEIRSLYRFLVVHGEEKEAHLLVTKRRNSAHIAVLAEILLEYNKIDFAVTVTKELQLVFADDFQFIQSICVAFVKHGHLDRAKAFANDFPKYKSEILASIAQAVLETDLKKALEIAEEIPDPGVKTTTLCSISQILIERGDLDQALDVVIAMPIYGWWKKEKALEKLSLAFLERGDLDKCLLGAQNMSMEEKAVQLFFPIASFALRHGEMEKVTSAALSMRHQVGRNGALVGIAEALSRNGEKEYGTS